MNGIRSRLNSFRLRSTISCLLRQQRSMISRLSESNQKLLKPPSGTTNNSRPVGVFASFRALPPQERLVVILCFSSVGFVGLYAIDCTVNPEQYPVTDNGDDVEADSWLIAVKKFFSWCLQMAKHDLNRDLERWRADALNEALEQNKISSNNK